MENSRPTALARRAHTDHLLQVDPMDKQMKVVLERLNDDVNQLLNSHLSDRYYWTGSMTDLVVACRAVSKYFVVLGPCCRPLTFLGVVRAMCSMLHVREPQNPWACLYQTKRRTYRYHLPLLERYRLMMFERGESHPLLTDVKSYNPATR